MKINDITSGVALLLFSVVLWTSARGLPNPADQLYGPAFFPQWIAAAMFISSAIMIATSLRQAGTTPFVAMQDWVRDPKRLAQFLCVPIAVIFYVYTVDVLGFMVAAGIVLFALLVVLGTRLLPAIPTTVGVILLIYALFDMLLRVPLPRGTLF